MNVLHALGWFIGMYPAPQGTSPMYQLWSGVIPALAVIAGVANWITRTNCHVHHCWRLGHYPAGQYRVCRKHHPDIDSHVTQAMVDEDHLLRKVSADT